MNRPGLSTALSALTLALILLFGGPALATTQTVENGALTATSSLLSAEGDNDADGDADTVTEGEDFTARGAVANHSDSTQPVTLTVALDAPGEQYDHTVSKKKALRPGETLSYEATETVTADHPEGDYTLTVDAAPKKGENVSASATLTVY